MAFQDHCASLSAMLDGLSRVDESSTFDPQPVLRDPNVERRRALQGQILGASAEYESQLEEIEQLRARITEIRNSVLSKISRGKNSLSPIAALPPEILSLVFDWVVNPPPSKHASVKDRESLMRVSKQWEDTALRSPALWNFGIITDGDFTSARKSFAHAGSLPIRLILSVPHRRRDLGPNTSADALDKDLDSSWVSRLGYVELSGHRCGALQALNELVNFAIERKLPMLRELHAITERNRNVYCRHCRANRGSSRLDVNGAWAPALTILSVRETPAILDVSPWSSITSLVFVNRTLRDFPWNGLYGGLRRASLLEELTIEKVRLSYEIPTANEIKIRLPRLRKMVLGGLPTLTLHHLLRIMHAPGLRKLSIGTLPDDTLNAMTEIDDGILSRWPTVVLHFTRLIKASPQLEELSLLGPSTPIVALLHTFSPDVMENRHLGCLLPITNLEILTIEFLEDPDPDLPGPLHQIPNIGEILATIQLIRMSRGARKLRRLAVPSCVWEENSVLLRKIADDVRESGNGKCSCREWAQQQMEVEWE